MKSERMHRKTRESWITGRLRRKCPRSEREQGQLLPPPRCREGPLSQASVETVKRRRLCKIKSNHGGRHRLYKNEDNLVRNASRDVNPKQKENKHLVTPVRITDLLTAHSPV